VDEGLAPVKNELLFVLYPTSFPRTAFFLLDSVDVLNRAYGWLCFTPSNGQCFCLKMTLLGSPSPFLIFLIFSFLVFFPDIRQFCRLVDK